ncbi:DNA ligase [Desulfurobacterium thermolithotrophum DSM 11699]|uniref:DNA ligase n=1 Tax=Desulfurobacterium thermolithotrophum (strain DSM 11699 / BSA) TaxID=868864 RepID=F0S3T1_DESTD|nr:NAD-dependent DNA ligase LigA [Desulfurobacterium thermolithotrophum]ADY73503.1 DNA ligase [Desulfurobacterium thermolithotrophum DSM 11699]
MYTANEERELQNLTDELLKLLERKKKDYLGKLSTEEAKELAEKLRKVIRYHDYKYYVLASPVISDYQYDKLFHALEDLEKVHSEIITPDSPTQRIAPAFTGEFEKVKHLAEMTSLENTYSPEDLKEWDRKVKQLLGREEVEYIVEPKFDGASVELVYEDDLLKRAVTRGDGVIGEDITMNVRTIKSIPLKAPFSRYGINLISIRGEIVMPKSVFEKLNKEREKQGLPLFANPRNAAAGTLRLKNPSEVAKRGLDCYAYQILYSEGKRLCDDIKTQSEALKLLAHCGFKSPRIQKVCKNIDEVIETVLQAQEERESWDFEADGMVVKVNDICAWNVLGETMHHPKWAVAYKFPAKQAVTKLVDVVWQVGRTGALTPVAVLEPVEVGGVVVSRASLFNPDFIKQKDIRIFDYVIVERAGETIPYIVAPIKDRRSGKEKLVEVPTHCPVCKAPIVKELDEAVPRCPNINCPAQLKEHLVYWGKVLDIKGLGESTANILLKNELVKSIADLYYLNKFDLIKLPGWGLKKAENLLKQIEKSKSATFWKKLTALGIRHVGEKTAQFLAQKFKDINELMNASFSELASIQGIGAITATSIRNFFKAKQNIEMIKRLEETGFYFRRTEEEEKEQKLPKPLEGQNIVFTGELEHFTRKEAQYLVSLLGGNPTNSVTKKTSFVVVGENPGSKFAKAQKLGIKLLNEEEFLKLIKKFSKDNPEVKKILEEKKLI